MLRRAEVEARTGLPKSTLYHKMRCGEFPKPIIGRRAGGRVALAECRPVNRGVVLVRWERDGRSARNSDTGSTSCAVRSRSPACKRNAITR